MTYAPEIHRHYGTRSEAWEYLASRGFTCCADTGWVNGRWAASVLRTDDGVDVNVWLRLPQAA
jgi:hypothetical protein